MIQTIRQCPDCASDRLFEQHHAPAGSCPDSQDGNCREWFCTDCGAALLIGLGFGLRHAVTALEKRDRVA